MGRFLCGLVFAALGVAAAEPAGRALVIDYELNPPDFSNELIRRLTAAGLRTDYRPYQPRLTGPDFATYRMLVLLASAGGIGSGLQLAESEIPALAAYVRQGGLLVLGVPSDPEAFPQLGPYNRLLGALGAGIEVKPAIADDDSNRFRGVMFPGCYLRPGNLVLDRATILETRAPAQALAWSSPAACAIAGLGRPRIPAIANHGEFPVVAKAACGRGSVLVTGRFNLNIGGYNGRVGVQPISTLEWLPRSDRFIQSILCELLGVPIPSFRPAPHPARNLAAVRRDVYGQYLDHGIRAAWGDVDHSDDWLRRLAQGFQASGLNYIWGVGWPERFVSTQYGEPERKRLRHAWETFAGLLDGSPVGWTIGINYPGTGFDPKRYEQCRGADERPMRLLAPLDLRYWNDLMIPAIEEVARFSLRHPSVKGVTVDFEMYGYEPVIFYPEAVGFEDSAFQSVAAGLPPEARTLPPERRYTWLRDHAALGKYFQLLEGEAEKLGRGIRQRIHAINPKLIFGAYQAGLPYTWFYRGLMRGLSTPEMPMIWMSFSTLSADEVNRWWQRGQYILNASALMLGLHPIPEWENVMRALRRNHDGYWLNRYNWLIDDAAGRKSIEIPDGTREQAWRALAEANKAIP